MVAGSLVPARTLFFVHNRPHHNYGRQPYGNISGDLSIATDTIHTVLSFSYTIDPTMITGRQPYDHISGDLSIATDTTHTGLSSSHTLGPVLYARLLIKVKYPKKTHIVTQPGGNPATSSLAQRKSAVAECVVSPSKSQNDPRPVLIVSKRPSNVDIEGKAASLAS